MSMTLTTSRDPKGLKFMAIVEAVYNKAGLDDDRAQRLNESPEFVQDFRKLVGQYSLTNQFADQEVKSTRTYPPEYRGAKPIREQVGLLAKLFSVSADATFTYIETKLPKLPDGAESYFAIVRWQKVGKTYNEAVELMLPKIAASRPFYNYRKGELGSDRLCQHERTMSMLAKIEEDQPGDILVIPAQFGLVHRGRSVNRGRECFRANEFGFGAFQVGCMTLTHAERFVRWEQLHVDCPGDKYAPDADGRFVHTPCFSFDVGWVGFDAGRVDSADGGYGSVSGFLSQETLAP